MSSRKQSLTMANRERKYKGNANLQFPKPYSFTSRLETFYQVHMINDEPVSYQTTSPESLIPLELRTSSTHTNNRQVTLQPPQWLAQVGFYYTPISIKCPYAITCSCCNQIIKDPIPLDVDISKYHHSLNPSCALATIWKFRNSLEEDKISTIWKQDPIFGENINSEKALQIRRETFQNWKHKCPNIETMVSSGMYYDPYDDKRDQESDENQYGDDRVICMYCGLRLEDWEEGDDPIKVHQQENPDCWVFNYAKKDDNKDDNNISVRLEHNKFDEIPDFDFNNGDISNEEEIEVEDNDGDDHSVISLATTTTTTTTALPVEILDQDEVEEFLNNSQNNNDIYGENENNNNKMVEIPSMKSSDLSQFFTELDNESDDGESAASFFASNRKRRREREKEKEKQRQKELQENVEPIVEEKEEEHEGKTAEQPQHHEVIETNEHLEIPQEDDNANAEIQEEDNFPVYENDDFAFENMDAFAKNNRKDGSIGEEEHERENEDEANDHLNENVSLKSDLPLDTNVDGGVHNDKQDESMSLNKDENTIAKDELNEQRKESPVTTEKCETNRVEQLENELKMLKMQIEALQNNQLQSRKSQTPISSQVNISQNIEEVQPVVVDEMKESTINDIHGLEHDVQSINKGPADPTEGVSSEVYNLSQQAGSVIENYEVLNENEIPESLQSVLSPPKVSKTADVVIDNDHEKIIIKQEPNLDEYSTKVLEQPKKKKSKKSKHKKSKSKRALDENDMNQEIEVGEDLLTLTSGSSRKKSKKSRRKRQKLDKLDNHLEFEENADEIYVKQEPLEDKTSNAKGQGQGQDFDFEYHSEVKIEESSEIPTEVDAQLMDNDPEISVVNTPLPDSEHNEKNIPKDGAKQRNKHEISPTLMRKKARTPTPSVEGTSSSLSDAKNSKNEMLNALMDQRRAVLEDGGTGTDQEGEDEGIVINSDVNDPSDKVEENDFILENDFIIKNQSTPYMDNTKKLNLEKEEPGKTKGITELPLPISKEVGKQYHRKLSLDGVEEEKEEKDDEGEKEKQDHIVEDKIHSNEGEKTVKEWVPIESSKYREFYKDIHEATGYVKEVLDSKYDLLGDDLEGLLTEFIAEIPPDQLKMTVKEWIKCQEEQAVGLVLDKADEMMDQFKRDQATAIEFLETLPEE